MLTQEETEVLCRVGPGSPMGEVLRRYWFPAFLLSDLPEPDCPPIGVTVLGEDFVAFKDSDGRLGFLDELCCHRGASLTYGRVEEGGIRCLYHAWKFDVDGKILETPNCADPRLKERFTHGSYPVRAAGGLGWVYLGAPGTEPPFPNFPWMQFPEEEMSVTESLLDCNWVQIQEGSIDSSHLGLLHLDTVVGMRPGPRKVGSLDFEGVPWVEGGYGNSLFRGDGMPTDDNAPPVYAQDTPFGFQYAAVRRSADPSQKYVRLTALAMPYTAHIGSSNGAVIVVPRDDESCSFIGVHRGPPGSSPPPKPDTPAHPETREVRFPSDARRFQVPPQHRAAMLQRKSFAGFPGGNRPQDAAVQGVNAKRKIYSRANEHLVAADTAIARFRHLLLESLRRVEAGQDPLGLGEGYDFSKIQGFSGMTSIDSTWRDLAPGNGGADGPLPVQPD